MESFGVQRYQMVERFRWMFRVRLLAAAFVFIVYFFVRKLNVFTFPFIPFSICCMLEAFANQPYPFIIKRVKNLGALTYVHLVADIILLSVIIHYLGGIEFAFFSVAYPLIIVLAGIMLSGKACYTVAFFSSIAYSVIVGLEYYGLIPHNPLFGFKLDGLHQFGIVAANILFFYFVAFLSGYSTELIQERTKKLEQEKQFSEDVVANMVDGLLILDEGGRAKEVNKAVEKLSGYSREELVGINLTGRLFTNETGEKLLAAISEMKAKREIRDFEAAVLSKDGRAIPVSVNASFLRVADEAGFSVVAMLRDITKDKAMDKLKTEFISTITHELLTPLTSINGFVTMMLGGKVGPIEEKQREFLEIVKKQAKHLKGLIESMLDFSRIETGRLELNPELIHVEDVVKEVVSDMQLQVEEKEIRIGLKVQPSLHPVLADRMRIGRAFGNIIGNAIKFTPRGRGIEVEVSEDKGFIMIGVRDEGIGITKENLSKVFDRFYQVDSALTRVVGGAGMGLSIAKEIVEKHDGKVWAESKGLGEGSKFIFTIPVS
jgi:PAS domain S-box-containing protein